MNGTEALSSRRWRRGLIENEERVGAIDAETGSEPLARCRHRLILAHQMPAQI